MTHRSLRIAIATFFAGVTVLCAQDVQKPVHRCSASARECEQEIREMMSGRRYLGAALAEMSPGPGIYIKSINPDGPAAHVDLHAGDRVIAINGRSLMYGTMKDYKNLVAEVKDTTGVLFIIVDRHGTYRKSEVRLAPYPTAQVEKAIAEHLAKFHGVTAPAGSGQ
jgi:predicted metalloprotease with PDZ domain